MTWIKHTLSTAGREATGLGSTTLYLPLCWRCQGLMELMSTDGCLLLSPVWQLHRQSGVTSEQMSCICHESQWSNRGEAFPSSRRTHIMKQKGCNNDVWALLLWKIIWERINTLMMNNADWGLVALTMYDSDRPVLVTYPSYSGVSEWLQCWCFHS